MTLSIKIQRDEYPESPRDWPNLGRMACWHRRYNLGDEQPSCTPEEFLEGLAYDANPKLMGRIEDALERVNYGGQYPQWMYDALERYKEKAIDEILNGASPDQAETRYTIRRQVIEGAEELAAGRNFATEKKAIQEQAEADFKKLSRAKYLKRKAIKDLKRWLADLKPGPLDDWQASSEYSTKVADLAKCLNEHFAMLRDDERRTAALGAEVQRQINALRDELCRDFPAEYAEAERGYRLELNRMRRFPQAQYLILPLYLYDHSGLSMNTSGFHCPWDSGQVGFIYCSLKAAAGNWSVPEDWDAPVPWSDPVLLEGDEFRHAREVKAKPHTITLREATRRVLKGEVQTYDQYLQGDIWEFVIENEDGDEYDSGCGIYGYDVCEKEAQHALALQEEALASVGYRVDSRPIA